VSSEEARAYAMACELHRLLGDLCALPQNGRGSCIEAAWDCLDDVLTLLQPEDPAPGLDYVPLCRLREMVQ
jgi:hypothetical protein